MKSAKRFTVLLAAASLVGGSIQSVPSRAAVPGRVAVVADVRQDGDDPSTAEQELFLQAQRLFEKNQFEQSARVLQDLLRTYPQSSITDLTLLWLARSYIGLNNLPEAERVGTRLREIRDTPFLDIYQSELADARRRAGDSVPSSQPAAATQAPQLARVEPNRAPPILSNTQPADDRSPRPAATPVRSTGGSTRPARLISAAPANADAAQTAGTTNERANTGVTPNRRGNRQRDLSGRRQTVVVGPNGRTQTRTGTNQPPDVEPTLAANNTNGANNTDSDSNATNGETSAAPPAATPNSEPTTRAAAVNTGEQSASSGGVFSITVKQVPNLALALRTSALPASPGQVVSLPLTITNTGNKEDQFRIETDLPAEYQPTFSVAQSSSDTGLPILVTPQVPRGANYEVQLNLRVPEAIGDGQQRPFVVRAASQFDTQVERVAQASLSIVAAALAATSAISQPSVLPNESFTQTIQIRNTGSAPARAARAEFVFDPDFELVNASPSPLVYDRASRTAVWSLGELAARDNRSVTVNLRAVTDALAASKPLGRGTLRTQSLPVPSNFDGPSVTLGRVTRSQIDPVSPGQTATPGDTIFVPFVVRNPSNYTEAFELRVVAPNAPTGIVYADTNGDGQHQENEPAITQTTPVDARGGAFPVLLRVEVPRATPDRQQFGYNIVARSLSNNRVASEGSTVLTVAAPRVRIRNEQTEATQASGDSLFYQLVLVNEGAGLARNLVTTEQLPAALQFVSSEPKLEPQDGANGAQRLTWRVPDLAPGDTAVLRIAVKLRPGLDANTVLRTQRELVYQDGNGNTYRGQ